MQAALPVAPDTTASIAGDLSRAEASMPSGSFIGFQGTQQLYIAMLDRRQQQSSSRVAYAGACGLSGLCSRAQVFTYYKGLIPKFMHTSPKCCLLVSLPQGNKSDTGNSETQISY